LRLNLPPTNEKNVSSFKRLKIISTNLTVFDFQGCGFSHKHYVLFLSECVEPIFHGPTFTIVILNVVVAESDRKSGMNVQCRGVWYGKQILDDFKFVQIEPKTGLPPHGIGDSE